MPLDLSSRTYCGVCSLPPEYCEYMPCHEKCRQWLADHDEVLYERLYPSLERKLDACTLASCTSTAATSGESEDKIVQTASSKRAGKAAVRDESVVKERQELARQHATVIIRRHERTKRKATTMIIGLDLVGLDLKTVSKRLANKFACGCSVTDITPSNVQFNSKCTQELCLQGDYLLELEEFLPLEYHDNIRPDQIKLLEK